MSQKKETNSTNPSFVKEPWVEGDDWCRMCGVCGKTLYYAMTRHGKFNPMSKINCNSNHNKGMLCRQCAIKKSWTPERIITFSKSRSGEGNPLFGKKQSHLHILKRMLTELKTGYITRILSTELLTKAGLYERDGVWIRQCQNCGQEVKYTNKYNALRIVEKKLGCRKCQKKKKL